MEDTYFNEVNEVLLTDEILYFNKYKNVEGVDFPYELAELTLYKNFECTLPLHSHTSIKKVRPVSYTHLTLPTKA